MAIAEAVRTAIRSGQLAPGEPIPSTRTAAEQFNVHRNTVRQGFDELVAEGWLINEQRKRFRVYTELVSSYFAPRATQAYGGARGDFKWRFARKAELSAGPPPEGIVYDFRSGRSDLRYFPTADFKSHFSDALKYSGPEILDYGSPAGHPPLVASIELYLRRVRAITGKKIVVTHGSQEAIFLTALLLVKPGDEVGVEGLGYPPALEALRMAGARLVPIQVDGQGMDTDHLEHVLRTRKLRLIYTTPLHQYPTTVTLPINRRSHLYRLAERHNVPILEDDYDHEYHYRCQPMAPMASSDSQGLVIYVSSFSKLLLPSIRLGFMAVAPQIQTRIAQLRRTTTGQNDLIIQDTVARWIDDGGFERHLRRTRRVNEERRNTMAACCHKLLSGGLPISWVGPDGGMAIWLDTGAESEKVEREAARLGVAASAELAYQRSRRPTSHLRLGFARHSPVKIENGMELLGTAIARAR